MIVDAWSNLRSPEATKVWATHPQLQRVTAKAGSTVAATTERTVDDVVAELDACGADLAIVSGLAGSGSYRPTFNYTVDEVLADCAGRTDRVRASFKLEGLASISEVCRHIERIHDDPALAVVRVVPSTLKEPFDSRRFYPIYERCEAFALAVSINVGVGAPGAPAAWQDPSSLDLVLIDFPELVVIAAHGGHPWESLLIRFMRTYDNLYLSNSGGLAKYLDPAVVRYMDSSTGNTRVVFATDAPQLPLARALESARQLPISDEAMENFLGENARRIFRLDKASGQRGPR
ncbi:MAG TPA: amidohydrolase family protein [Acidimicrobiales bacterium]|jgi:predicted TIM-barrel fold metal-dependent hydrolase